MIRNAIAYIASSAASRTIGLILLPIVTYYLTPEDYGVWAVYAALLAITGCFVGMNLHGNVTRKFFSLTSKDMPAYTGNILLVLVASFFVATVVWSIVLQVRSFLPAVSWHWLLILPAVAAAQLLIQVDQTYSRCREQVGRFSVVEIGLAVTAAAVSLPLLIYYDWGWQAPAAGLIVSSTAWAALAIAGLSFRRDLAWSPKVSDLREILTVSLPQIPHLLGYIVLTSSDRILLAHFLGTSAAGVYAIAFTLAAPVMLLSEGVFKAWTPWLHRTLGAGTKGDQATLLAAARGAMMAVGALALLTIAYVLVMRLAFPFLIDQRYSQAASLFPVVAVALWLRSIYQVAFSFLLYVGNTLPLAKANIVGALINIVANIILIPIIGLWAAPIALLSGFVALCIVSATYQARYFPVPWRRALRP